MRSAGRAARSTRSRMTLSASLPVGGTRRVRGPRSCARRSSRSGCPSNTSVARAPFARQNAATRRTTSWRRSSGPRGPPQEPSRLLPSIRYGMQPDASDVDQLPEEALPLRVALGEDGLQLARVEEHALAERAAVDADPFEVL